MIERTEVGTRNWALSLGTLLVLGACGGSGGGEPAAAAPEGSSGAEQPEVFQDAAPEAEGGEAPAAEEAGEPTASNTPAPWQQHALRPEAAPEPLLSAWARADNAQACMPLALPVEALGRGRARAAEVDGGWAVEFDVPGAPGLRPSGRSCRRCGRAAFGMAGTGMAPEELEEAEGVERLADGSLVVVRTEDGVASAQLAVPGQDCVYQLWSFLGEEHLRELLGSLRFVAVERPGEEALAGVGY